MDFLRRLGNFYNEINPATLSGAIDVVVVRQPDGSLKCSPFHVRFGKLTLLWPKERIVRISVNEERIEGLHMKVGHAGECYFVEEATGTEDELSDSSVSSPIATSPTSPISTTPFRRPASQHQVSAAAEIEQWDWGHVPKSEYTDKSFKPIPQRSRQSSESDWEPSSVPESDMDNMEQLKLQHQGNRIRYFSEGHLADMSDQDDDEDDDNDSNHDTETEQEDGVPHYMPDANGTFNDDDDTDQELNQLSIHPLDDFTNSASTPRAMERPVVSLSLCGKLEDSVTLPTRFEEHRIDFDQFQINPSAIVENKDLVVKIDTEYYTWQTAAPMLLCYAAFDQPLSTSGRAKLSEVKARSGWWFWGRNEPQESSQSGPPSAVPSETESEPDFVSKKRKLRKVLRPTSNQLELLNLRPGANLCEFSVTSKLQGKAVICCNIYLWNWDANIVVSDIDGTITKSDILGHAAQLIGTDWTHLGVAKLFDAIAKNGYQFLYLSSRSISQSNITKGYLKSLRQEDFLLPDGPMLLSPASLFKSLQNEVVHKISDVFKTSCLKDIKSLFRHTANPNPFNAGFGNRDTDIAAYTALNIPPSRIFIIDAKSCVKIHMSSMRSSYVQLDEIVHHLFPPMRAGPATPVHFNSSLYWFHEHSPSESLALTDEEQALLVEHN